MARTTGGVTVVIPGLDAMIDQVSHFPDRLQAAAEEELGKALETALETSRSLAHVSHDHRHSGQLKASLRSSSEYYPGMSSTWVGKIETSDRGAAWEMQRGGDHAAFIDGLDAATSDVFETAMDRVFTKAMGQG